MAFHPGENRSPVPSLDTEPELRLVINLEPRRTAFVANVGCVVRKARTVRATSPPAKFWTDVFVPSGLPWGRMAESLALHLLAVVAVITVSNAVGMLIPRVPEVRLKDQIYHYDISNYLPPLDT